jgi:uncharacterized phage-associated protein
MGKMKAPAKENIDGEKIKELILMLSELSEGDEFFGSTKLNKLLFFVDFLSYLQFGKSISGHMYEAQPEGPMIKRFYEIRREMEDKQDLFVQQREFGGYVQHKIKALTNANPGKFTGDEMALILHVISDYRDMNASRISALSHEFLGWQAVNIGEVIPYETALVSTEDLTSEEWEFPEKINFNFAKHGIPVETLVGV